MGGKCQICGYSKCDNNLALHHIDPKNKDLSFSDLRANPKSWELIVNELRKCVLLCHNCHGELHANVIELPKEFAIFNEEFVDYKPKTFVEYDKCSICGNDKEIFKRYCSLECSGKSKRRFDWDSIDLKTLYDCTPIIRIAEMLDVSDAAVHKRLKKLGLK